MKKENRKNNIQDYMKNILEPLDLFYSSHYKTLITDKKEKNKKILEESYLIYLQKLEEFSNLADLALRQKNK